MLRDEEGEDFKSQVFLSSNLIDGVVQMADDVKFIVNDPDVGRKADDVGKRLPHIHYRKLDLFCFVRAKAAKEEFQILFLASTASKSDKVCPFFIQP